MSVTPLALVQGQIFTATVTVTPNGAPITMVRLKVQGAVSGEDSADVVVDGPATISHVYQVPRTAPNGSVTVTGEGIATGMRAASAQATVAVADTSSPVVTLGGTPSSGTVQPGDSLKLSLQASDNAAIQYNVIRISGAFSLVDSVANTTPFTSRTLALKIPASAKLGMPITAVAQVADWSGHSATTPVVGPIAYADTLRPALSFTTSGGRSGVAFAPGDTLVIAVSATDNHKLARVGYRIVAPGSGGDSTTLTTGTFARSYPVAVQASWTGAPAIQVFAMDSSGNTRLLSSAFTVADRTRRAIQTATLDSAVRDIAVDSKRNVAYLSITNSSAVRVLDITNGTFGTSISLPSKAAGIDISTGGDSLLVALAGTPYVRVVRLTDGTQDTIRVLAATDTRSVVNLRVAADNTMVTSITFAGSGYGGSVYEYDLATGAKKSRLTVTELVPIQRSGNRQRVSVIIDDSCCPLGGNVYDASSKSWTGGNTVSQFFVKHSMDYTGSRMLVQGTLFSGLLASLGSYSYNGVVLPAVLAPDGLSAYWATTTGVTRIRFSDGGVIESFTLNAQPTSLFSSGDGLTIIAITSGKVSVIDTW